MYSEGRHDYEALFVSDGKLVYLLANPSPSGVEGTSGGLYITNNPVNTGQWYKVSDFHVKILLHVSFPLCFYF